MLDADFLKSLGIKEEFLPLAVVSREVAPASNEEPLPLACEKGVPPEFLKVSSEELEILLKQQCTQEKPYIYLMPNGKHKVAVYPREIMERYDLEFTIEEFITFAFVVRSCKMEAYQTRDGQWYCAHPIQSPPL